MVRENREDSEKNEIPLNLSDLRTGMCSDLVLVSREKRRRSLAEILWVRPSVDGPFKSRVDGELVVDGDVAVNVSVVICELRQRKLPSGISSSGDSVQLS